MFIARLHVQNNLKFILQSGNINMDMKSNGVKWDFLYFLWLQIRVHHMRQHSSSTAEGELFVIGRDHHVTCV